MTTQGAVQQSSPDVHLTIEQDGEQRVRIQSAQLREIGEQLRGPRSFSIFNSLVLPALVALLTTILTSGFQYVSWRNSVLLQNANDVVTRATEAYEAATEMIGKRRYSTLLFVPAMRDIISANTPALADANESAKPAEPKQPGVNEPGISRRQPFRLETQLRELLRPDIVHEHVGAVDQAVKRIAVAALFQIEHDAALVAVDAEEHRRHAVFDGWARLAGGVAARGFDLDDVGAEIAEPLAGERPHRDGREIDDPDAVEGKHRVYSAASGRPAIMRLEV